MKFVELSVGPVSVPAILAITVFSIMCLLYIRVGRAMWRQDSSTGVDLQWNKSSTARAQERSGIVLGGFSVTFLLASIAIALFPDEIRRWVRDSGRRRRAGAGEPRPIGNDGALRSAEVPHSAGISQPGRFDH
jgi:hypothetical protein